MRNWEKALIEQAELFHPNREIYSPDAVTAMGEARLDPGNRKDLEQYAGESSPQPFMIVALGDPSGSGGMREVSCLKEGKLSSGFWMGRWTANTRFLGIRTKISLQ